MNIAITKINPRHLDDIKETFRGSLIRIILDRKSGYPDVKITDAKVTTILDRTVVLESCRDRYAYGVYIPREDFEAIIIW